MKKILAGAVAVVVGAFALPASAQETLNAFGAQGQLAIDAQGGVALYGYPWQGFGGQVGLTPFIGWRFMNYYAPGNGRRDDHSYNIFYINPGIDYFVIDHLSIGGEIDIAHVGDSVTHHNPPAPDTTGDNPGFTYFGVMPRVGYDIPIGSMFSLWPRGGIGFSHFSRSGGNQEDQSGTAWLFYADVPFMFHFVEHFFMGVGPGITVTLASSFTQGGASGDGNKITDIRLLSFLIGGYI